jgi:hypothetical protein
MCNVNSPGIKLLSAGLVHVHPVILERTLNQLRHLGFYGTIRPVVLGSPVSHRQVG